MVRHTMNVIITEHVFPPVLFTVSLAVWFSFFNLTKCPAGRPVSHAVTVARTQPHTWRSSICTSTHMWVEMLQCLNRWEDRFRSHSAVSGKLLLLHTHNTRIHILVSSENYVCAFTFLIKISHSQMWSWCARTCMWTHKARLLTLNFVFVKIRK